MEKVDVVLVVLNEDFLDSTIRNLNLDNTNLVAIITDVSKKTFTVGEKIIPTYSISSISDLVKDYSNSVWLISGGNDNDCAKMRKFLSLNGVLENNIVICKPAQFSPTWQANLRHVEEYGADFFATGNEYMRDGLNLNFIPCVHSDKSLARGGANLADANQNLQQSYLTAKYVFEHVAPGMIKFVLIGLTPDSLHASKYHSQLKNLVVEKIFTGKTKAQADLNFDDVKKNLNRNFSVESVLDWKDDEEFLTDEVSEENVQILQDYIQLCLDNGAKPIGVVFPFAPAVRETYNQKRLADFRATIRQLKTSSEFTCIDWFDHFGYDSFCDMTHLNLRGSLYINSLISMKLNQQNLIPAESFCDMTYEYFYRLSKTASKREYNAFMERVFAASAKLISRKNKIKVGFVLYDTSMWCGDDLYNLFANNKRFETTVFICQRPKGLTNDIVHQDYLRGIELFRSHSLNIVTLDNANDVVPVQDVLIYLTPYFERLIEMFRPEKLTAKTLTTHITYSLSISIRRKNFYNSSIFQTFWRIYLSSVIGLKVHKESNRLGMPRGVFSGYPKMDIFFQKDAEFHFDWKMTRPDSKKIIWAPHHSIDAVTKYATFQWNYQFMYEFAKAHPEISWVVKPHPNLAFRALQYKIFPSVKAFEEYLQKWNDLPNAQVYTGAYYQSIFATSDGMIHDSGSFIAEYQYVDKPMIFLTRANEKFNELGNKILEASYLVDGKDLDAIAAMIQKVFIEGNDDKAAERREVFNKYLNYPNTNGMLASEFIYKSISEKLEVVE